MKEKMSQQLEMTPIDRAGTDKMRLSRTKSTHDHGACAKKNPKAKCFVRQITGKFYQAIDKKPSNKNVTKNQMSQPSSSNRKEETSRLSRSVFSSDEQTAREIVSKRMALEKKSRQNALHLGKTDSYMNLQGIRKKSLMSPVKMMKQWSVHQKKAELEMAKRRKSSNSRLKPIVPQIFNHPREVQQVIHP